MTSSEGGDMYPHVTQFETRELHVRQQLELRDARRKAAPRTHTTRPWWRRALTPVATDLGRRHAV